MQVTTGQHNHHLFCRSHMNGTSDSGARTLPGCEDLIVALEAGTAGFFKPGILSVQ